MVAQITNKDTFILQEIITLSNEVFKDVESEKPVGIGMLGNPTRETKKSNVTEKLTVGSEILKLQAKQSGM